jgi:hypothetical protein
MTPNNRFDTDPQQQRFALLLRAGQSHRYAPLNGLLTGTCAPARRDLLAVNRVAPALRFALR